MASHLHLPHPFLPTLPLEHPTSSKPKTSTLRLRPISSSFSSSSSNSTNPLLPRRLRAAVIGGGPAGSSAAESLAAGGVETFLFERSPSGSKPCGGAIPLCMLREFSLPPDLVDRRVSRMRIVSPSNRVVDFGRSLLPHEHIPMLRREVLDSFLRSRAQSRGAHLLPSLVTSLDLPTSPLDPYVVRYIPHNTTAHEALEVDVVIAADGANSRVAKLVGSGDYTCAMAFQERVRLPPAKMAHYEDLAEMYVGSDVSPDFYAWVFPKCDHVAVGTGTVASKKQIKRYQRGVRERARERLEGGEVVRVEAHPIPEHPRPRRVVGRVALVGDAAGYVTKCAGEGIYFAARSGRMCGEAVVRASERGRRGVTEGDLKDWYLRRWDGEFRWTFRFLDLLQRVFYGSNEGWEALVEMCGDEYVQRRTFDSYLYKKVAPGEPWDDVGLAWKTVGCLFRARVLGSLVARNMEAN